MAGCGWLAPRSARPRHIMGLPHCPKLLHSSLLRFCVQGLCHGTIVEPSLFRWRFAAGIDHPAVAPCRHMAHALSFIRLALSSTAAGADCPPRWQALTFPPQWQASTVIPGGRSPSQWWNPSTRALGVLSSMWRAGV